MMNDVTMAVHITVQAQFGILKYVRNFLRIADASSIFGVLGECFYFCNSSQFCSTMPFTFLSIFLLVIHSWGPKVQSHTARRQFSLFFDFLMGFGFLKFFLY